MSCTVYFLLPLQGGTVSSSENVLFQYLQFVFFVLIFLRESNLSPLSPTSFTNFFFTASCFPRQLLIGVTHTGCFFFFRAWLYVLSGIHPGKNEHLFKTQTHFVLQSRREQNRSRKAQNECLLVNFSP